MLNLLFFNFAARIDVYKFNGKYVFKSGWSSFFTVNKIKCIYYFCSLLIWCSIFRHICALEIFFFVWNWNFLIYLVCLHIKNEWTAQINWKRSASFLDRPRCCFCFVQFTCISACDKYSLFTVQSIDDAMRDLTTAVQRSTGRVKESHSPSNFKKDFGKREVQRSIDSVRKKLTDYERWKKDNPQSPSRSPNGNLK